MVKYMSMVPPAALCKHCSSVEANDGITSDKNVVKNKTGKLSRATKRAAAAKANPESFSNEIHYFER